MIGALLMLLGAIEARGEGVAGTRQPAAEDNPYAKAEQAVAGRIATVEVFVRRDGGREEVVLSSPALVVGPRNVATIAPALERRMGTSGASARIIVPEGPGIRKVEARLVRTDLQTGLSVLEAEDLRGAVPNVNPSPLPATNAPVLVIEPGAAGRFRFLRGRVIQTRAYIEQGRGKNPLILVQLLDHHDRPSGRSYTRWEDDLASGSGAFLADVNGGFLGLVTPPSLGSGGRPASQTPGALLPAPKSGPADGEAPHLDEGKLLALPGEIARFVSDNLVQRKAPPRGYFGASFREVADPPEEVQRLGVAKPGVRVEKVYPGGPADQGGLQQGDWLVAISEKRAVSYADVVRFSELVEYGGQGKTVRLIVARESAGQRQLFKLKVKIGTR